MTEHVQVKAARIPDRDRLLTALRDEGLDAEPHDERIRKTVDAVGRELTGGPYVRRYAGDDGLAGTETYGGGRYVIDTVKGADLGGEDGRLVIDLNFAYNPSCAYDPAWVCPLAPMGNVVTAALAVGELAHRV